MNRETVHEQLHGYRNGHQLLSSSVALGGSDQDLVNRISDLTGRLRPSEKFEPYLTTYPLPSGTFYVVARTFQDLRAPRSGCVLTRSLLIRMETWVALRDVEPLLAMLVGVRREDEASPRDMPRSSGVLPGRVSDKRVVELVHSLFFGDGRPVVVFDTPEAEAISSRLLAALWPALRSNFSLCTLALGPRRLGDREFDLLFGPLLAQSRFSDADFLRIGVQGSEPSAQFHHLAGPTAAKVFFSGEPRIVAPSVLRLFGDQNMRDRADVRVALRWAELASRAETTPSAVLGMLDILNVRGGPGVQEWGELLPKVSAALEAAAGASARDAWSFFLALTAKVEWRTAPAALARKFEGAVRYWARTDAKSALAALRQSTVSESAPVAVLKGLGDGVADWVQFEALSGDLRGLEPKLLLRLVAASDAFGEVLARGVNCDVGRWLGVVVHMLEDTDVEACYEARRRLMPLVDDAVAAEAIPPMLVGVGGAELADLAVELAGGGRFEASPFLAVFAEVTRNSDRVAVVRNAVASRVRSADAEGLLLEMADFTRADLDWLLALDDGSLAGRLLAALLARVDAPTIRSLLSTRAGAARVLSTLQLALPESALQMARVLTLDLVGGGGGLDFGFGIVSMLPREMRQSLERWLLRELLSSAPLGDDRLAHALSEFAAGVRPDELVAGATAPSIGARRVSENLEALNTAPRETRNRVLGVVDVLSRRLVERRREELSAAAYRAWAALLGDAARSERQAKATATVFGFALRRPSSPVSPLLVVSFPTVYQELPRLKKLGLSSGALPFLFYWLGEKKPKRARRELVDVLVRRFLYSSWPPADLVIAVLEADAGAKVLKRVRKRAGSRYLRRIEKDASRLDGDLRSRVLACLADTA